MFVQIIYGSEDYKKACEVRQHVLRKPFGFDLYTEDLTQEASYKHFGLRRDEEIIACLIAIPSGQHEIQFRQMAVAPKWQNHGFGKLLLSKAENLLVSEGIQKMWLNARQTATNFYLKMGYHTVGDIFYELNIPHYKMEKFIKTVDKVHFWES